MQSKHADMRFMNDVTQSRQATHETNPAADKQANNELCSHTTHSGQAAAAFQAWPWHEDPFRSRDVAQDFGGEAPSDHETESTNVAASAKHVPSL